MKEKKLTEWYSAKQKPVRKGMYEREWNVPKGINARDYWDGEEWFLGWAGKASKCRAINPRRWRGLASDPAAK